MKRYVWLNLLTGEFSNSWTDEDMKFTNDAIETLNKDKDKFEGWKLIEFNCISDPEFTFTRHMKLR